MTITIDHSSVFQPAKLVKIVGHKQYLIIELKVSEYYTNM